MGIGREMMLIPGAVMHLGDGRTYEETHEEVRIQFRSA